MQRVRALGVADRIVVATDNAEIRDAVLGAGGECVITSADHPSGTDRVAEVTRMSAYKWFDAVLNVQGDEPFVSGPAVRGALQQLLNGFPLGTAAIRAPADVLEQPDVVKVVTADDGAALYFSRAPIPFLRDQSDAEVRETRVLQHVGIYAYTPDALSHWVTLPPHPLERIERLEQLRPLAAGVRMGVAVLDEAVRGGVDTEQDLERANTEWQTLTMSGM
jgi:3-deoxy-manno-octulosonate cytidylyltransferase (CMP-KDO synthetase)